VLPNSQLTQDSKTWPAEAAYEPQLRSLPDVESRTFPHMGEQGELGATKTAVARGASKAITAVADALEFLAIPGTLSWPPAVSRGQRDRKPFALFFFPFFFPLLFSLFFTCKVSLAGPPDAALVF